MLLASPIQATFKFGNFGSGRPLVGSSLQFGKKVSYIVTISARICNGWNLAVKALITGTDEYLAKVFFFFFFFFF